jgi:hypothetical protein
MLDGLIKRARHYNRETVRTIVANIVVYSFTREGYPINLDPTTDGIIKDLAARIDVRGDANYCLCRIVLESLKPEAGWSYHSLSDAVSALETAMEIFYTEVEDWYPAFRPDSASLQDCWSICIDAAAEIRRRLLDPYEDKAILKNGDMPCFANEDFAYKPLDTRFLELVVGDPISGDCGCGCTPLSGCSGACAGDLHKHPEVPLVANALTDEQFDAVESERANQYRDPSMPPPAPLPRDVTAEEVDRAARKQG